MTDFAFASIFAAVVIVLSAVMFWFQHHLFMRSLKRAAEHSEGQFNTSMTLLDALRRYNRHDERVTELLKANNEYLERARAAERRVKDLEAQVADLRGQVETLLESNELLEQELAETKRALATEEAEADRWAGLFHAQSGGGQGKVTALPVAASIN